MKCDILTFYFFYVYGAVFCILHLQCHAKDVKHFNIIHWNWRFCYQSRNWLSFSQSAINSLLNFNDGAVIRKEPTFGKKQCDGSCVIFLHHPAYCFRNWSFDLWERWGLLFPSQCRPCSLLSREHWWLNSLGLSNHGLNLRLVPLVPRSKCGTVSFLPLVYNVWYLKHRGSSTLL